MSKLDQKQLKNNGFIKQVQKNRFSMRIRVAGGCLQTEHLKKVYEIAHNYGEGFIHLTARQSIEIPFIKEEDIEEIKKELFQAGMEPAACGPRVRTVTACQGCSVCQWGLIDSHGIAAEFDKRYYGKDLPHKFKLGITGCRNNCLKAEENDLGVKGAMKPEWIENKCRFCGLCESKCPMKAISVEKNGKKLIYAEKDCINCGKCVKACPVKAWEGKSGFNTYFGGLYGNRISIGRQLVPTVYSLEELHKVVEATLEFFITHGEKGERFANTLERVGWDLLSNKLFEVLGIEKSIN